MNRFRNVQPCLAGCADYPTEGDEQVFLRLCLVCCYVGCCCADEGSW